MSEGRGGVQAGGGKPSAAHWGHTEQHTLSHMRLLSTRPPSPLPRLATLEDSVKAALRKLTEQEKDNSRRIQELEVKLGAKMKEQIEGALDTSVSSKINSITESVKESVNTQVQELSANVAKGGRSWVFPFVVLTLFLLAMLGWFCRFQAKTNQQLNLDLLGGGGGSKKTF